MERHGRTTARLTVVHTLALVGVEARPVRLECAVSGGLPGLRLVGLPDAAVREAGERVRAALQRSGFRWPPLRIVVNLAPADLPKVGTGFDLPLALGVLAASGQVDARGLRDLHVHGEVGLDGTLRGVPGVLAVALGAARLGATRVREIRVPFHLPLFFLLSHRVQVPLKASGLENLKSKWPQ